MITRRMKTVLATLSGLVTTLVASNAFAQAAESASSFSERDKWIGITAGMGIAIAAFGGALGQGRTASTALDGIARNPGAAAKLFTPMILGLALIESLVIYSLIISILLLGKIH